MGFIQNLLSKGILDTISSNFRRVEGELNDHLEGINANTNEIQSIYEVLTEIESKIDKLASRVDNLNMKIEQGSEKVIDFLIEPLTSSEKKVFVTLYTSSDAMTYKQLSEQLEMQEIMIQEYLTSLIAKGVPISKKYQNNMIFVSIDQDFKEAQAKKNIVKYN